MKKLFERSLFIFRRDLRMYDNTALIKAHESSHWVVPCFIFDPFQVGDSNDYKSNHALQFMLESLQDLEHQLKVRGGKISYFYGNPAEIIEQLIATKKYQAVFVNRDYTPYSLKRDQALEAVCKENKCAFISLHDALLHEPEKACKKNGKPYTIFTPFFKNARMLPIASPQEHSFSNYATLSHTLTLKKITAQILPKASTTEQWMSRTKFFDDRVSNFTYRKRTEFEMC